MSEQRIFAPSPNGLSHVFDGNWIRHRIAELACHAKNVARKTATPSDTYRKVAQQQSDGTLADYFRFPAKAGERISGEVVATRLGWDFDSLIRVLDTAGNELLIADDDAATGADARFLFTAPRDAEYLLEVRDNRYKPGGRYRLRLGDFPLVSTTLPLFAQRGIPGEIVFRGPHAEAAPSLTRTA